MPFYVGGHTDVALKRAARVGDGWTSAMLTGAELADIIGKIKKLLAENGRVDEPFEYQAVCIDKFGVDGHRELAEAGVTDNIVMPWVFDGLGFDAPLDGEAGFGEEVRRHLHPLGLAGLMTDSPVHLAGKRSREAAVARDKEAWLAVFADDAVVEDPIGPSHFDPEGKGHRGKEAIAKFYDMAIAPSELTFNFRRPINAATRKPTSATSSSGRAGTRSSPKACSPTG